MALSPSDQRGLAARGLAAGQAANLRIVSAETCTAGLVSACLTSVSGASKTFERGFVLYHDSAKATGLGVPEAGSRSHGAVTAQATQGLSGGALHHTPPRSAAAV